MLNTIWTIGHSTRTMEAFLNMLKNYNIETLADIRRYPGSKKYPQYNQEELQQSLTDNCISYIHFEELGGRRKPIPDSPHGNWRNPAFRGYADYMETTGFINGIERLEMVAKKSNTVYMCSEAVWWRCHRMLISDYLKSKGWTVMHILEKNNVKEHSYSAPFINRPLF